MATQEPEGHLAKKGRTRKRDEEPPPSQPSYLAATTGGHVKASEEAQQGWPKDEPVDVEEGDITPLVGDRGGSLMLSSNLKTKLDQQWQRTVILKVLDRRFKDNRDYLHVLTEGSWGVFGQVVAVQRWSPSFRPAIVAITRAVVWVRIPNFPLARYHPRILTELGNLVGTTVRIDGDTLHANRGRYVRIAVDIDLTRPLPPTVELDGETLLLTYERLPQVCCTYGVVGHTPSACAKNSASIPDPPPQVSDAGPGESELSRPVEAPRGLQKPAPSNSYGPWTIVCGGGGVWRKGETFFAGVPADWTISRRIPFCCSGQSNNG
ncbi:hypothetical protein K2173_005547 [Erythroxylum novogranatense]|uniref:DUF4283 domain-containing protein n=1 Tax=Erythroxylum novogranatense TaxID=1862640 RepID=A0AAV8SL28_9ROSI|nr:hypothetical protein K2173_005547 [Erythroxylum novogranatense]